MHAFLKEDARRSHCNQAFDQIVAKNDKKVGSETLPRQRNVVKASQRPKTLTHWDLSLTRIKKCLKITLSMSLDSFKYANLFPRYRVEFKNGQRKYQSIYAGSSFNKLSPQTAPLEKYSLIPKLWQVATPNAREQVVNVSTKYGDNDFCFQ